MENNLFNKKAPENSGAFYFAIFKLL